MTSDNLRPILVTGAHRSGTTWVGKMLSTEDGVAYISEPLNVLHRPGVFRAAVGHSRGGLTAPATCQPIPYLGSLGLSDIAGNSQATQTDAFAKWDGCTSETLPTAPQGGHICTPYKGCGMDKPVIWCSFDGPHTPSPTDSGKSTSWMPAEVWPFLSQF